MASPETLDGRCVGRPRATSAGLGRAQRDPWSRPCRRCRRCQARSGEPHRSRRRRDRAAHYPPLGSEAIPILIGRRSRCSSPRSSSGISLKRVILFLPDCFSEEEVAILRDEAEQIYATNRQEVWREKTGAPRSEEHTSELQSRRDLV